MSEIVEVCLVCVIVCVSANQVEVLLGIIKRPVFGRTGRRDDVGQGVDRGETPEWDKP